MCPVLDTISAFQVCQVFIVVMETAQLLLRQFKKLLTQSIDN